VPLRKGCQFAIELYADSLDSAPAWGCKLDNRALGFTIAGRNGFLWRFHAPFRRFRRPICFFRICRRHTAGKHHKNQRYSYEKTFHTNTCLSFLHVVQIAEKCGSKMEKIRNFRIFAKIF
jgi:hypothetical protein